MWETNLEKPVTEPARRFGGMARLYGDLALARLAAAHVCVVGVGGVGSWAAEALARSGVGTLTLIDLDHVAESNINRQIHALEATLGQSKIDAMAERIRGINPDCRVVTVDEYVEPDNVARLIPTCDGVIDAIDQVKAKVALIHHCHTHKLRLITTGGAGGRVSPALIQVDDLSRTVQDALAASVRARLRREYGFPRDPKRKFGVPCVYSTEPLRRPQAACETDDSPAAPQGLNCAGYGSSVAVTGTFGFTAAAWMLDQLLVTAA